MSQTEALFNEKGIPVTIFVASDLIPCPCQTPEGFRNPHWHKDNPTAPECNDAGFLGGGTTYGPYNSIVIPASSGGRINWITQVFGEIQTDDRIAMLPPPPLMPIDFTKFDFSGSSYVTCYGKNFAVIGNTLVPDPHYTSVMSHWECALRVINPSKTF